MKRWRIVAVVLLCLVLAGSIACMPFGGGGDEEEAKQQLVEVVREDLIISVSGSGNIDVSSEAKLGFGTSGIVDEVYVEEGDEVSQGDVLATLDIGPLELALARAEVALATAEYNLDRAENPYSRQEMTNAQIAVFEAEYRLAFARDMLEQAQAGGNPTEIQAWLAEVARSQTELIIARERLQMMLCAGDPDEIELMEMQVEVAEQSVAEAEEQLDGATLTAPFDGIVAAVYINEEDTVAPGVSVIHLIDPSSMELKAEVDEIDIPRVEPGQKAIISVDALPDLQLEGVVNHISPLAIELAGVVSYGVTIAFDTPEGSDLKVGMSAIADIIIEQRNNVLLVPDRAIGTDSQGTPMVRVVVGEQIEDRPIVIGISDGFRTEIVEGLNEGEIVVLEVQARESPDLFPGAPH